MPVHSTKNSTSQTLGVGATWTGTAENWLEYSSLVIWARVTGGIASITVRTGRWPPLVDTVTYSLMDGVLETFVIPVQNCFYQVEVLDGGAGVALDVNCVLHAGAVQNHVLPVGAVSTAANPMPVVAVDGATETSLSSIDGKMVACDTGNVVVSVLPMGAQEVWSAAAVTAGSESLVVDKVCSRHVSVYGTTTGADEVEVLVSYDNVTFYKSTHSVFPMIGDFYTSFDCAAQYLKLRMTGTAVPQTITAVISYTT